MTTTHRSKQEDFFMAIGSPVDSRTVPPPKPGKARQAGYGERARTLTPKYRTELSI